MNITCERCSTRSTVVMHPDNEVCTAVIIGDRCETLPHTDAWMQGFRYGEIIGFPSVDTVRLFDYGRAEVVVPLDGIKPLGPPA